MKRISCLLFAAAMLCFTGCQHDIVDDKASVSYDGYWETFKVRMGDEVYEDYYLDPQIPVSAVYSLALADNGTGYLSSPMSKLYGEEDKQALNWKEENGHIKLLGETEADVLDLEYIDGDLLMQTDEETEIWFKKVYKLSFFAPSSVDLDTEGGEK
ncbi:MAG: hypothetical protein BWZ04_02211 [Firmicutes bacterium ADurb.BinA205]|nr:MAG: hypothetical protein BWZ04_02211 [Firmicutes bacterium ADurb.BinA205]